MHDEWYRRPGAERCERGAGCSIVRSIDDAGVRPGLATGSARARAGRRAGRGLHEFQRYQYPFSNAVFAF